MASPDLAFFRRFAGSPAGRGLLQAIRVGEGTAGPRGYQTMFGGGTFSDLSRHPDRVIRSGGYSSAAAGAYQFLPGTWNEVSSRLGLPDFSPASQDVAALAKARERLMPLGGLSIVEKEGLSPRVAAALAPEWASFPTLSGSSYYGQPVKPLSRLQEAYGQGQNLASQPAPAPRPAAQPARLAGQNQQILSLMQQVLPSLSVPQMTGMFGVTGSPLQNLFNKFGPLQ